MSYPKHSHPNPKPNRNSAMSNDLEHSLTTSASFSTSASFPPGHMSYKEKKHMQRIHFSYKMNSATSDTNSSELTAQKSLTSFMKLASVRQISPSGLANIETEEGMRLTESMVFSRRFSFAFGGSMDPSYSLNIGLQLRPNYQSAAPTSLPIRKSSLRRLSTHEITNTPLPAIEPKSISRFWLKCRLCLISLFKCKSNKTPSHMPTFPVSKKSVRFQI